jgi:hypothetical protein
MCCFSRPVKHVSQTQIFARSAEGGRQILVYSMNVALAEDLAMILPLPTPPGTPEDGARFIDLSSYPGFFSDLANAFPAQMAPAPRGRLALASSAPERARLRVHPVGLFEASFVPSLGDFDRLDERFRLSPDVWNKVPRYRDYGFAVFKLKRPGGVLGWLRRTRTIHPMALEFPRRDPGALFFPTVHVHDGELHPEAVFDHALYCQPDPHLELLLDWQRSDGPLGRAVDAGKTAGVVLGDAYGYRRSITGQGPNSDIALDEPGLRAGAAVGEHYLLVTDPSEGWVERPAAGHVEGWPKLTQSERGRIKEELACRLTLLTRDRRDAWGLARYRGDLPDRWSTFYETFPEDGAEPPRDQPCRIKFFLWNQRVTPLEICLAFKDAPPRHAREAIEKELQKMLDDVASAS